MNKVKRIQLLITLMVAVNLLSYSQHTNLPMDNNGCSIHSLALSQYTNPACPPDGNPWTLLGPNGGDAIDLAADPTHSNILFAAVDKLFRTTNNGVSWQAMQSIPISVNSVEVNANGVVFASGLYTNKIVYCSTDNGDTWQQKSYTSNGGVYDIACDQVNPSNVYVALSINAMLKSTNLGTNWSTIDLSSFFPSGYSVYDIAVDPANGQNVFAIGATGFTTRKIIYSTNGGTSWVDRSASIPAGGPCNKIIISGANTYLIGGILFGGNVLGAFKSTDQGVSWLNISSAFPNKVTNDLIVHPTDPNKLFVGSEGDGLYYTTNGGTSWTYTTAGVGDNGSLRSLAFEPGNPNIIYAGFQGIAVCKSTNAGLNWSFSNNQIATLLTNDIEVDLNNPSRMLVSFEGENSGGCYYTTDGGSNWSHATALPGTRYSKVSYGSDGAMYAWSNGPTTIAQEGLYKSTDGGLTWANMGPNIGPVFETQILSLYISPTNPNLIFIGGNNFGANGYASVIHRSTNGGQNWANVYIGPPYDSFRGLFANPSNEQIVYASYLSQNGMGGVLKSTDGGTNWAMSNNNLPGNLKMASGITCVQANPNILYCGIGGYNDLTGTVYKSTNAGNNWSAASLSLGMNVSVNDIVVSPADSNVIYVSSSGMGIYLSTNAGASWAIDNTGLPAVNITGLSRSFLQTGTRKLCASTYKSSAYITNLYIIISVPGNEPLNSFAVFPNPSSGIINVSYPHSGEKIKLVLYNIGGSKVFEWETAEIKTNNSFSIKLPDIPSGVYLLKMSGGDNIYERKIVIQ